MLDISVGKTLVRKAIHATYGGGQMGGISASKTHPVVMLFSNPKSGQRYGYFDRWGKDGCFHYAGEGQYGDQEMTKGNKAIRDHVADKRTLHLFEYVEQGVVAYQGEFTLDLENPCYTVDRTDADKNLRVVIMFRLRPRGPVRQGEAFLEHTPTQQPLVTDVPIEENRTERAVVTPTANPRSAERKESALVQGYRKYLKEAFGRDVCRKRIIPPNEQASLYTDLYDAIDNRLIEAKGSVSREAVRMAIGQLLDYQRFISPTPSLAILVPQRPRPDLLNLCAHASIDVIWPEGAGYNLPSR